jgi:hypothetical protein
VYTGNLNMARVGLYWILGKEKCAQHLNHGWGVRVGGERRDVLGKGNSTQHLNHGGGVWVGGERWDLFSSAATGVADC